MQELTETMPPPPPSNGFPAPGSDEPCTTCAFSNCPFTSNTLSFAGGRSRMVFASLKPLSGTTLIEQLEEHLEQAGFHFNQVVRTWIYERDIVAMEMARSATPRQRYQILNDARRQFFTEGNGGQPFTFSHDLPPASTGIGMVDGTFV